MEYLKYLLLVLYNRILIILNFALLPVDLLLSAFILFVYYSKLKEIFTTEREDKLNVFYKFFAEKLDAMRIHARIIFFLIVSAIIIL